MPLKAHYPTPLTPDQQKAVEQLDRFLDGDARAFVLMGFAGTGKTFLLKGMADYLRASNREFALMAPTGRAARVLSSRTGHAAHTIHRSIYALDKLIEHRHSDDAFKFYFGLKEVSDEETDIVLIVDEASMVSDTESEGEFFRFGSGRLLADLVQFSKIRIPGLRSKILFVGDPAQLPPVTDPESRALDTDYLRKSYGVSATQYELQDVVRQKEDSPILEAATSIRETLRSGVLNRLAIPACPPAIEPIEAAAIPAVYLDEAQAAPRPETILVTYKNATALSHNKILRNRVFGMGEEAPPQLGDRMIVIQNNLRYGLLNGDFITVLGATSETESRRVTLKEELEPGKVETISVELVFRDVKILFEDETGEQSRLECKIIESLLLSRDRDLNRYELKALYVDFKIRNPTLRPNTDEFKEALKDDPYFHALRVKYGYAITCHKAQGGEWKNVIVIFEGGRRSDRDYFRWCYTAVTRAQNRLFTVGAPQIDPFSALRTAPLPDKEINEPLLDPKRSSSEMVISLTQTDEIAAEFGSRESEPISTPEGGVNDWPAEHPFLREKFLGFEALLEAAGAKVSSVTHNSWHERYVVARGEETAFVQAYYTKRGQFRPAEGLPKRGNSPGLLTLAKDLFDVSVPVPDSPGPEVSKPPMPEFPEDKPFLRELYERLSQVLAAEDIRIRSVDALRYAQRYTFDRAGEVAVVDFHYDKKQRFTSVEPILCREVNKSFADEVIRICHTAL